ncbi:MULTISPECIES: phage baseplate assembly protein [unclassified Vibrio]|uniref:phage baseplate assembly protein domain-containing protein n=1 Tax=unclassified Vibrio TaxID=2614977 RepID=UPI001268C659|nr:MULTISPECIES: phage baseplate assembly protein [unclassified Vibrio]MCM5509773.1 phage baseplate assembly protein [Vibrio sp. SCSIO 43169]QFT35966.1 Bacteriophage Mu Gp45 protein [Vibrio sp. THAF64]QGM33866.1 Bacteriophage Mu Gp45 protein [Vibrio sp. THAF191d]QGN69368.1 Bacteriophage Mu Gp45 protein [Vibrio sp. THAF191c]
MSSAQRQQQQRLMARIKNVIGTGTVTGATTGMLQIRTATGRTNDRIKRVHNYGFMSRPLPEAKAYNLFIGGVAARGITVNVEDERYQIDLKPGEVAMLDDKGNLIHQTNEGVKVYATQGKVDVVAANEVSIKAPQVNVIADKTTFSKDVNIGGNLSVAKNAEVAGSVGGQSGTFGGVKVETHAHDYEDDSEIKTTREPNKA